MTSRMAAVGSLLLLTIARLSVGQEAAIPVPATIRADGVPEIPSRVSLELARYQNIRSASFQDWAGGGAWSALVTTRFADTPQLHRVAFPGAARFQLTFEREPVQGVRQRPVSAEILFAADEGGAENYQFFLLDPTAGSSRRITDGKARNMAPRWSRSGRRLAYSSNARNGRDMDLYVFEPDSSAPARRFKEVSGSWSVADWSPDEHRVVAIESISANESYVHLIDVTTGETESLTPRPGSPDAPRVAYSAARWSPDGRFLYWTSDLDSEFHRLVRFDLTARAPAVLTPGTPWDVEEFDLSEDGLRLAYIVNEDGIARPHVLDTSSGVELVPPNLPAGQIGGLAFRPGSHELGFTYTSARSPSDAYSVNVDSPTPIQRWTTSETGGLDTSKFAEPQLVRFPTFDDRQIAAFLYLPDPGRFPGPRPVLVNIHGGPESQFRPGFLGRLNVLVEELGIALLFPNVRGSAGYGKTYLKLDNGMKREDAVKDIGALLDWIKTRPDLDAARVGVTGGSYGGFMSLAVQVAYNDRLKAGIDVVGISSFVTFLQNTQEYRRDLRRAEYGDERDPAMREYLERISPLGQAAKIRTPLLVIQGQNDPRVPYTEAEQMVAALREAGAPVWYVVGKDEGHGFAKKPNQDYQQAVEFQFLREHLIGREPAPGR